eukprot:TRINITY_DN16720_c0_g1_i1.p1 TRINITY_DN16720_c0_g1~~TRINITY_DN16720_c0_g1_i1.p1  ORF type:complete len:304 (+),score=96.10 TRINITY_DN16720_c0_g1_i1:90-914(+)
MRATGRSTALGCSQLSRLPLLAAPRRRYAAAAQAAAQTPNAAEQALQKEMTQELQRIAASIAALQAKVGKPPAPPPAPDRDDDDEEREPLISGETTLQEVPQRLRSRAEELCVAIRDRTYAVLKHLQTKTERRRAELPHLIAEKRRQLEAADWDKEAYAEYANKLREFEEEAAKGGGYKLAMIDAALIGVLLLFCVFQYFRSRGLRTATQDKLEGMERSIAELRGRIKGARDSFTGEFLPKDQVFSEAIRRSVDQTKQIDGLVQTAAQCAAARK